MFDQVEPQVRADIESLEQHGYISDEFHLWGHTYVLRTLKGDEELAAGVVTKEYVETLAQAKAWVWANVSLSLDAIDDDYDFCPPVGPDTVQFSRARFRWVTNKYYWSWAEKLFSFFVQLQDREQAALRAVEDFPDRSLTPPLPEPGSLSDLGISAEELAPEEG